MISIVAALLLQTAHVARDATNPVVYGRADSTQIALLRAELDEAKRFRSDLLQTVNTTLATVAGLGVLLVGYSWFTNFRVLDREKAAIERELKNSAQEQQTAFRQQVLDLLARRDAESRTAIDHAISKALAQKVDGLRSALADVEERLKQVTESLQHEVLRREYDGLVAEARYWQLKGVQANELSRYREALTLAVKLDDEHDVQIALTNMIRLADAGTLPSWVYVPGIMEQLDALPPRFTIEKQHLATALANVPRA